MPNNFSAEDCILCRPKRILWSYCSVLTEHLYTNNKNFTVLAILKKTSAKLIHWTICCPNYPIFNQKLYFCFDKNLEQIWTRTERGQNRKGRDWKNVKKKVRIGRNERSSRKGISAWLIRCFELHTQLNQGPLSFLNTSEDDFFPLDWRRLILTKINN